MDLSSRADRLPKLQGDQLSDDEISEKQRYEKCRHARTDGSKGDVGKNIQRLEQVIRPTALHGPVAKFRKVVEH